MSCGNRQDRLFEDNVVTTILEGLVRQKFVFIVVNCVVLIVAVRVSHDANVMCAYTNQLKDFFLFSCHGVALEREQTSQFPEQLFRPAVSKANPHGIL
jgi:hypothetical protein